MPVVTTRDRLIDTAHELFYRDGFHAVGLDRIITMVGVTKTTFYNHFESKDDLILAVLRWHDQWWRDTFMKLLRKRAGDDPRAQLLAVFDALEELFTDEQFNGCIFINVAVEFPLPHDPAHHLAAEHKRAMEAILHDLATRAGSTDPEHFAQELALLMEGAYVTRQVSRNTATADIARRLADMIISKYLPEAA